MWYLQDNVESTGQCGIYSVKYTGLFGIYNVESTRQCGMYRAVWNLHISVESTMQCRI